MSTFPETRWFKCEHCGEQFPVTTWVTLNSRLTPELYQDLLHGRLFNVTCPSCGVQQNRPYTMLLHDMTNKVLIHLDYFELGVFSVNPVTLLDMIHEVGMPGYRFRIVSEPEELIEKAMIFKAGLDDRVIQIIKDITSQHYSDEFDSIPKTYLHIDPDDSSNMRILFRGPVEKECVFTNEMYELGVSIFSPYFDDTYEDSLEVDREWSVRFQRGRGSCFSEDAGANKRKVAHLFLPKYIN